MFNPCLYFKDLALYSGSGFAKSGSKKLCDSAYSVWLKDYLTFTEHLTLVVWIIELRPQSWKFT